MGRGEKLDMWGRYSWYEIYWNWYQKINNRFFQYRYVTSKHRELTVLFICLPWSPWLRTYYSGSKYPTTDLIKGRCIIVWRKGCVGAIWGHGIDLTSSSQVSVSGRDLLYGQLVQEFYNSAMAVHFAPHLFLFSIILPQLRCSSILYNPIKYVQR